MGGSARLNQRKREKKSDDSPAARAMGVPCETRPPFLQINRLPHRARRGRRGFSLALSNAGPPLPAPHHSSDRLRQRPSVGGYEASCDILPPRWLSRRCLGGAGRWLVRFPRHAQFADYPAHRARRGRLTQHPSGTALATLLRKATLRVGGYAFGGDLRSGHNYGLGALRTPGSPPCGRPLRGRGIFGYPRLSARRISPRAFVIIPAT